jgi:hypothetical protein
MGWMGRRRREGNSELGLGRSLGMTGDDWG